MKPNVFFLCLSLMTILLQSCKNAVNKLPEANAAHFDNLKESTIRLIDSVGNFFGNENWKIVNKEDTSYILFSRQNDLSIKLYQYKMSKGDSVGSESFFINIKNDSVSWIQPARKLVLETANENYLKWNAINDTTSVVFFRFNPDSILLTDGSKKIILNKTISFSDFLARSRYDYLHGTNFASDTTSFNFQHRTVPK